MSETCNRLNANLKLKGQPCVSCERELELGDAAAQCQACDGVHHAKCWDASGGCGTEGCANAPLKRLDDASPAPVARLGYKKCGACNSEIMESDSICPYCNSITSADGIYHGPTENAPGAVASLVFGILGLLVCGLIFGIVAISKSKTAKEHIASDPRYTGGGLATAGLVLGIIDLVAWGLIIMFRLGNG
jgi:hypothetical protein